MKDTEYFNAIAESHRKAYDLIIAGATQSGFTETQAAYLANILVYEDYYPKRD